MTKTRASERRRRRKNKTTSGGRPVGTFKSLFNDPQRFSVATWLALEPLVGPHFAARVALTWIEERAPITIEVVDDLLHMASTYYAAGAASSSGGVLDDRARSLSRKAPLVTSRATKRELAWLAQSRGLVAALLEFVAQGNKLGMKKTIDLLHQAGWQGVLEHVSRRLAPALSAGFPPYGGPITARVRRLLDNMRASKNR
jgi:hypothetical protein